MIIFPTHNYLILIIIYLAFFERARITIKFDKLPLKPNQRLGLENRRLKL
jgi:hypothetical protein